jgi:4-hydroxyphenylacetate 3-monooxygenase
MAVRTGSQFLDSLRAMTDAREFWMDGEKIGDVTTDPRFAGAAATLAGLYDMQHDAALSDFMTYADADSGERHPRSYQIPRCMADLEARACMVKQWADATLGMFTRTPDYMNIYLAASTGSAEEYGGYQNHDFAANMRALYDYMRANDYAMAHSLNHPQTDRSRPVEDQDQDLACKIVKETDAGITITGARTVTTLAAYIEEVSVFPSPHKPVSGEAGDYSFAVVIPVTTPGTKFIFRPPVVPAGAASPDDHPLAARFDETDAMMVFDNVFVPWERVFAFRDVDACNSLSARIGHGAHLYDQVSLRYIAKAEFLVGLALSICHSMKIEGFSHIANWLADMMSQLELLKAAHTAALAGAGPNKYGVWQADTVPFTAMRRLFPDMIAEMAAKVTQMAAGGLVTAPSTADLDSAIGGDVRRYMQSAGADAEARVRLMRLAFDATMSGFSGRQLLYERYFGGDPVRNAHRHVAGYDSQPLMDKVQSFLDRCAADSEQIK